MQLLIEQRKRDAAVAKTCEWIDQQPVRDGTPAEDQMSLEPKDAAYLNLIEPWWKILRSLALASRRFESWDEITEALQRSTAYWNAHRRPFVWGKRRRHRPHRPPGIALLPRAA
jgi:hypothetical protein